jgi:hypothetical protein
MCPACISSAALVAGSVMSTGGIAALAMKMGFAKKSGKPTERNDNSKNMTERRNDDGNNERNHK